MAAMTELIEERAQLRENQTSVSGAHSLVCGSQRPKVVKRKNLQMKNHQHGLLSVSGKNNNRTLWRGRLLCSVQTAVHEKVGSWLEVRRCLKRGQRKSKMKLKLCQS